MALSLQTLPGVALVHQPYPLDMTTNNYETQAGSKEKVDLEFNGTISDGEDITFSWTDQDNVSQSVTMTAKPTPDNSGNQFPTVTSTSDAAFQDVVAAWQENYYLYRDFDITYEGENSGVYTIRLKARFEAAISLSVNDNISNLSNTNITAGQDQLVRANFSVLLDIFMEKTFNAGDFEKLATLRKEVYYDNNYKARFWIHSILGNDFLQPELPTYSLSAVTDCTLSQKRYYVKYAEQYGDPLAIREYKGSLNAIARRGRLTFLNYKDEKTFRDEYPGNYFLTHQPAVKEVTEKQQEFLYWTAPVIAGGTSTANQKVKLHYEDGTTNTITAESFSFSQYHTYIIPAGFSALNLAGQNANKTVKKYEVWLEDNSSNALSDTRTYIVDRKYYRQERHFIFENLLGGFDTLRCVGEQKTSIENEQDTYQRSVASEPDKEEAYYQAYHNRGRESFQISTGHKSRAYIDYLQEALLSNNVYLVQEDNYLVNYEKGGLFVPVIINPDTFELYKDNDQLFSLKFTYKKAFDV